MILNQSNPIKKKVKKSRKKKKTPSLNEKAPSRNPLDQLSAATTRKVVFADEILTDRPNVKIDGPVVKPQEKHVPTLDISEEQDVNEDLDA